MPRPRKRILPPARSPSPTPAEAPQAEAPQARMPIAVVLLAAMLAMGRATWLGWTGWDDDQFLTHNGLFNPPTWASLWQLAGQRWQGVWTPLTNAAWWIVAHAAYFDVPDRAGLHLDPALFHTTNLAAHLAGAALAFALLARLTRSPWAAACGAVVFAAHPVQVEAVAWACGTKDLLAGMFALAALVAIARDRVRPRDALVAIACAALAMLSKPSAVVIAPMMGIVAWLIGDRPTRAGWAAIAGAAALAVPTVIVGRIVQVVEDLPPVPLVARPLVALDAVAIHAWHLACPAGLCANYGLSPQQLLASPRRWVTWLVPLALAAAVAIDWRRRRDRAIVGGALLAVVALAPNLGLAAFEFQVYSTVADRYAYLAMIGVGLIVARLIERAGATRTTTTTTTTTTTGAMLVGLALASISIVRVGDWQDARTLWTRVLAVNPTSPIGNLNAGVAAMAAGDLPTARARLEFAARDASTEGYALTNLIFLSLREGQPDAATDSAVRLLANFRARFDYDPAIARQTAETFASQIERESPAAAARLRASVATTRPASR